MSGWTVVSFATRVPHYERFADALEDRLAALGIAHHVERIDPPGGSKVAVALRKPAFVLDCLDRFGPVIWFDVDGDIREAFDLPDGFDVGLCRNPKRWADKRPDNEVTAGVAAFADTDGARRFLRKWRELCEQWRPGQRGDHRRLCLARRMVRYREADITEALAGKMTLRGGTGKTEVAL